MPAVPVPEVIGSGCEAAVGAGTVGGVTTGVGLGGSTGVTGGATIAAASGTGGVTRTNRSRCSLPP